LGGEAEETVPKLIEAIKANSTDYSSIEGLSYRHNGGYVSNPAISPPEDLDRFAFPARDLLLYHDSYNSEDMGVIMTSRGCPFHCAFCSHVRNVRFRGIDNVLNEIRYEIPMELVSLPSRTIPSPSTAGELSRFVAG
jgi:radical SAM superfamily enzyme YgiQ (UPF0313 family)